MTARELKAFLDSLPPEQLEMTVWLYNHDEGCVELDLAEYRRVVDSPSLAWLNKPEGIHLR